MKFLFSVSLLFYALQTLHRNHNLTGTRTLWATNNDAMGDKDDCYPCDPECSARRFKGIGMMGDTGIMYSVSGTKNYAELAFLPVVKYMQDVLEIPGPMERAKRNLPKWALVTEPYLCHTVLSSVISFFDIVIVHERLPGDRQNPHHHSNAAEIKKLENAKSTVVTHHRRLKTCKHGCIGTGGESIKHEIYEEDLRHWVKAFKVYAMANSSPFKRTIYMDVDTIPCKAYFAEELVRMYGHTGIALLPEILKIFKHDVNTIQHYYISHRSNPEMRYNTHNSALVVLNLESKNTKDLLQRYASNFLDNEVKPILDQPSLGRAMAEMFLQGRLDHMDIDKNVFCKHNVVSDEKTKCQVDGGCLVVHKVESDKVAHEKK